jgi:starvation-inducible outer membrane lipoprotein
MGQSGKTMKSAVILVVGGALAGCVTVPPAPLAGDVTDPTVATQPIQYRPVVTGYESRRPVEVGDWRELNRRVGPQGGDQ